MMLLHGRSLYSLDMALDDSGTAPLFFIWHEYNLGIDVDVYKRQASPLACAREGMGCGRCSSTYYYYYYSAPHLVWLKSGHRGGADSRLRALWGR